MIACIVALGLQIVDPYSDIPAINRLPIVSFSEYEYSEDKFPKRITLDVIIVSKFGLRRLSIPFAKQPSLNVPNKISVVGHLTGWGSGRGWRARQIGIGPKGESSISYSACIKEDRIALSIRESYIDLESAERIDLYDYNFSIPLRSGNSQTNVGDYEFQLSININET